MRRTALKTLLGLGVLSAALLASGCGFQLRGQAALPFNSAHIDAPGSSLAPLLSRSLAINGKQVSETAKGADIQIRLRSESRTKEILALSGGGKVREYRLQHQLTLSAAAPGNADALPPTQLTATRDLTYDDTQILAKEGEEALLYRDMEQDLLQQILRRLSFARIQAAQQP